MTPVWLLRLVPRGRWGGLLYAIAALGLLLGGYALTGLFGERPSRAAPANVAVFFAVILAYIVPVFRFIVTRSRDALGELAPHLEADAAEVAALRGAIGSAPPPRQLAIAVLGFTLGALHNLALAGSTGIVAVARSSAADAAVVVGTLLVWVVMTTAIVGLVDVARLFARLGRRVRVDLLQPRSLTPFARVAVISTLAIIGAQAAFPVLWLNTALSALASVPGLVATTIPLLFLFFMPLLPVRDAIAAARRAELERLDREVAGIAHTTEDEAARLARLVPLLAYRQEIERVHEWPFDTSVTGRLGLYLVIPPFTWIAAALVEHLVEGAF